MRAAIAALSLAAVLALAPRAALADSATAEALFRDGKDLMTQLKFESACSKFAESQKQDPQLGTLLALGDCYSKAGKTASEWATYNAVAFEAKKKGRSDIAEAAQKKAADLEPSLSKLTITAADAATPGLLVRRDGDELGRGALGTAIPVDPGAHVIEATAPGYEVWQTTVTIVPNHDAKSVLIPALQKKDVATAAAAGGGTAANPTKRTAGLVVGGVGVASLALGGIMGALALSDKGSATDDPKLCGAEKTCSAAGKDKIDSASTKALVSTIGFGVGIAAVGTGAFLFFTSRGSKPADEAPAPGPAARVVPSIGPGGGGLALTGAF